MFEAIKKSLVEGTFFHKLFVELKIITVPLRLVDRLLARISLVLLTVFTRIQNDKIVFLNFRGDYDCNPKWICEEIIRRGLKYQLVWGRYEKTSLKVNQFPPSLTLCTREGYELYQHMASAKIIIDNGVSTAHLHYRKKPGQILIETWHGSLGIKKFSRDTVKDPKWIKKALQEGKMTDYCLSNSTFEDGVFREDYWKETEILRVGHARNDILVQADPALAAKLKEKLARQYEFSEEKKICLYAPTFRDDKDLSPYLIDYAGLQKALTQRFGGEWVIFTRFHDRVRSKVKYFDFGPDVVNVSAYPDIQEIALCTDVGITDYSSWICDYILTRRPGFLFATDMQDYEASNRKFFFPLDTMPFPLALNNRQLIENIRNFDNDKYLLECEDFLTRMGCMDDGHAAERIVDKIQQIVEKGANA